MIRAIITIRPEGQTVWPEVGMTHRMVVTRSTVQAVMRVAEGLAEGRSCRIEAWNAELFHAMPKAPTVIYLNVKGEKDD